MDNRQLPETINEIDAITGLKAELILRGYEKSNADIQAAAYLRMLPSDATLTDKEIKESADQIDAMD